MSVGLYSTEWFSFVLDDDKYGHDFMGEARFQLNKLKPGNVRQLCFYLDKHYQVTSFALSRPDIF